MKTLLLAISMISFLLLFLKSYIQYKYINSTYFYLDKSRGVEKDYTKWNLTLLIVGIATLFYIIYTNGK